MIRKNVLDPHFMRRRQLMLGTAMALCPCVAFAQATRPRPLQVGGLPVT